MAVCGHAAWQAIVTAVRACVGTPFRPQGRTPGLALDCVGVVLVAAKAAGLHFAAPGGYSLSGAHAERIRAAFAESGCCATATPTCGDIIVAAPSPRQRHLGVLTPAGVVHAHAGLGRVVEGPLDPDWIITGAWRLPGAQ